MEYPKHIHKVIKQLNQNGHQAWIVGGAVRDYLRGIKPKDYDIATTALPEQVAVVFSKTIPTGIKHGTITAIVDSNSIEITTLRCDGEYTDNRRPDNVAFTSDIIEDLKRRDFTINAMAFNQEGLVDPFGGEKDLKSSLIKCVGNPDERFNEDALRLLRAVRFATTIQGTIEQNTLIAIKDNAELLASISVERITAEMLKLLAASYPSHGIRILFNTGLISMILPEMNELRGFNQQNPYHDKTILEHTLAVIDCIDNVIDLRLAALLHDIGKPTTFSIDKKGIGHFYGHDKVSAKTAEEILQRWRVPKHRIVYICKLIANHMRTYGSYKRAKVKQFIADIGEDSLDGLFKLMVADKVGKKPPYDFTKIYQLKFMCADIIANKEPLVRQDLAVNGHDLKAWGLQGLDIGIALDELLAIVRANPQLNNKKDLQKQLIKMQERYKR